MSSQFLRKNVNDDDMCILIEQRAENIQDAFKIVEEFVLGNVLLNLPFAVHIS